jgi:hypothetical protein
MCQVYVCIIYLLSTQSELTIRIFSSQLRTVMKVKKIVKNFTVIVYGVCVYVCGGGGVMMWVCPSGAC